MVNCLFPNSLDLKHIKYYNPYASDPDVYFHPVLTSVLIDLQRTRACAIFFCNPNLSSSDPVLVNGVLALDSPCVLATVIAWETVSIHPVKSVHDPVKPSVPLIVNSPTHILSEFLENPIVTRLAVSVAVLTTVGEVGRDYQPCASLLPPDYQANKLLLPTPAPGYVRALEDRNMFGFRQKISCRLLETDSVLPTGVFGVTKSGAIMKILKFCITQSQK